MANRQMLAQIGVFALLGLNVGAYYVFWPVKDLNAHGQGKTPEQPKDHTRLLPPKRDVDDFTAPRSITPRFAPSRVADAPRTMHAEKTPMPETDSDAVARLLRQIENDAAPKPVMPPPLQTADHDVRRGKSQETGVDVASPLTPKAAPEVWVMTMEKVGNQTSLVAKLRNSAVEFTILCDRVDTSTPGGIQAIGNVTVAGTGLNVSCQRLTLPFQDAQMIFEAQVSVASGGSTLRGERIVWEAATRPGETQPANRGLELRPTDYIAPIEKK